MWIMITKVLPIEEKFCPEPLDIYWGLPWNNEKIDIRKALEDIDEFSRNKILKRFFKSREDRPYLYHKNNRTNNKMVWMNDVVLDNEEIANQILDYMSSIPWFYNLMGFVPNNTGKLRIMVNGEPVGIFPHEYSVLTKENMQVYLEESHTLVLSDAVKEVFDVFDEDQRFIRDAAMLDGCTYDQASRVAIGKDPEFEFPSPIGYYSCREDVRSIYF